MSHADNFNDLVAAHLPKVVGGTTTWEALKDATRIRRGLITILANLQEAGIVSFTLDAEGQVFDAMVITRTSAKV